MSIGSLCVSGSPNNMGFQELLILYCIVLYCILRPYTDGRLDRYRIGIPRELSEIRTQPWLSEESLTCDPVLLSSFPT